MSPAWLSKGGHEPLLCQGRASEQRLGSAEASPPGQADKGLSQHRSLAQDTATFRLRNHEQQQLLILTRQSSAGRGLGKRGGSLVPAFPRQVRGMEWEESSEQ